MGKAATHIGLVGLGRTGRTLFRLLHDREDLQLAAVSDPSDRKALAYLLRFDTQLGRLPVPLTLTDDSLEVGGRRIRLLAPAPAAPGTPKSAVPTTRWDELGVDTVVDASGVAASRAEVERHLAAGARRVILCTPPSDAPDVTVVMGVNDDTLRAEHRMVVCASPVAHAAAPAAMLLADAFGIRRAFLTTIESYADDQRLADVPEDEARRGRAAAENIVPRELGAVATVESLLPQLHGKLSGLAMNVPLPDGSALDLVCWHDRPVTTETVNDVFRQAAAAPRWAGVLDYEEAPIVSSDALRRGFSATFDSLATMVLAGNVSKTLIWFDSTWGFAHRVIDLIERFRTIDPQEKA